MYNEKNRASLTCYINSITLEKCVVAKAAVSFRVCLYHNAVTHWQVETKPFHWYRALYKNKLCKIYKTCLVLNLSSCPPLDLRHGSATLSVQLRDRSWGCNCRNIRFLLSFLDIDECHQGSHDCLQNLASCSNTNGSYNCTCHDGYMGDGKTFCKPKGRITGTWIKVEGWWTTVNWQHVLHNGS